MVVTELGTTPPASDVVFIVEATASLAGHFDTLKANYIVPTLE